MARRGAIGQERRAQPMPDASLGNEGRQFTGTAIMFDTWAMIGGPEYGFRERIAEGALTKTLRESDIVFLDGHDPKRPISRMSAETLRLATNSQGLAVDSDMDTRISYVNDLALNVENRNVKGMSFGFYVPNGKDEWVRGKDGVDERTVLEMAVHEVSSTAFPAYVETDAAVRSAVLSAKARRGDLTAAEVRAIVGASIIDPDEQTDLEALALLGENGEPPSGTRTSDLNEPADATRAVTQLKLRMQALAALHGFRITE